MISDLAGENYGTIWIDVEVNPSSGCGWSGHTYSSNCDYLIELIDAIQSHGRVAGVYTS